MPPPLDDDDLARIRDTTNFQRLDDAALCNLVEITGACAPLVGESPKPALVFTFTHVDGTKVGPIVLVLDETLVHPLVHAVHAEGLSAIAKARKIRGLS